MTDIYKYIHKGMFTTDRAKKRAKTFEGIARAMAEQWGSYIESL